MCCNTHDKKAALVAKLINLGQEYFKRSIRMQGQREWVELDLTMPQLKVLLLVATSDGTPMSHIARITGMTLSTATGVADRLIAQGLVRREQVPTDRRLVLLQATEAGMSLVNRMILMSEESLQLLANRLSLEELTHMTQAAEIICRLMEEAQQDERSSTR